MSGRNAEIDSSWKLLASTTVKLASLEMSTREISGVPIFPATCTGNPAVSRIWPTSDVVVVLPFEPVMHTRRPRRNRHASSISLHTGTPIARAAASAGIIGDTPGLGTIKSPARRKFQHGGRRVRE